MFSLKFNRLRSLTVHCMLMILCLLLLTEVRGQSLTEEGNVLQSSLNRKHTLTDALQKLYNNNHSYVNVMVSEAENFTHRDTYQKSSRELNHLFATLGHKQKVPGRDVTTICDSFAKRFADAAANYTRCFIVNSRPLQLCVNCVEEYLLLNRAYAALENVTDHPMHQGRDQTSNCRDWILNADRVMAIQQSKTFYKHLWESSHCENCFAETSWKHSLDWKLSDHFLHFRDLANETVDCFANYTSDLLLKLADLPYNVSQVETNQSNACTVCKNSYNNLNDYYATLNTKYGVELCMDIVDTMNYTRIVWANTFNCTRNTRQDAITITVTCLFLLLPAVFYIASHIHYQRLENKIVKQNRMMRSRHASVLEPGNYSSSASAPSADTSNVHDTLNVNT